MKKKLILKIFLSLFLSFFISGCTHDSGQGNKSQLETADSAYETSDSLTKYNLSSKLLNTLFKGVDPTQFFDKNGKISFGASSDAYGPNAIRQAIDTPLDSREIVFIRIDESYRFDDRTKAVQYPITTLYEMPLSRDYFNFWMAYILANTILFSPAVELDTTEALDAQRVFYRLVTMLDEDKSIQEIVYDHMISQENWRRFRSPEDNTREMMEIFLNRFIDDEVPKAAKACQNWYLSDDTLGYELVKDYNLNEDPQAILDTEVTACEDFYRSVAAHPTLLPKVVRVLVDYFYDGYDDAKKESVVEDIVAAKPTGFKELFTAIIFSENYLLGTKRPKKFEEAFLGTAQTIFWKPSSYYFRDLNRNPSSTNLETLEEMKQPTMSYKLGRPGSVPQDSLSFSYFHKAMRDRLFLDRKTDQFNEYDAGWQADYIDVVFEKEEDFVDYFFVTLLGRMASDEEKTTLSEVFASEGIETNKVSKAVIIMDYISRLSELYYFR